MAMPRSNVSLFNYADFKSFLRDVQLDLKKQDSKYSHRFIAEKVGAGASGWFSNIISGRIALTSSYRVSLAKFLELPQLEQEYFEYLVGYDQAGSLEEKRVLMQKIVALKGVNPMVIEKEQFEFYSRWYISAIRELLFIYPFRDNFHDLAKKVTPPITTSEAKEAIALLEQLDLIHPDERGFYRPKDTIIENNPRFAIIHWANQMESKGKLGVEAVSRFPRTERDISEVFIPLSEKNLEIARNEIAKLRSKLLTLSESDTESDRIYQCNLQLFPLSEKIIREYQ